MEVLVLVCIAVLPESGSVVVMRMVDSEEIMIEPRGEGGWWKW